MPKKNLDGVRVAILVTDDFEQVELTEPKEALEEAGAKTTIVAPKAGQVQGFNHAMIALFSEHKARGGRERRNEASIG